MKETPYLVYSFIIHGIITPLLVSKVEPKNLWNLSLEPITTCNAGVMIPLLVASIISVPLYINIRNLRIVRSAMLHMSGQDTSDEVRLGQVDHILKAPLALLKRDDPSRMGS